VPALASPVLSAPPARAPGAVGPGKKSALGVLGRGQKRCPQCSEAVGTASKQCRRCDHEFAKRAPAKRAPDKPVVFLCPTTEGGCGRAVDTASKKCKLCDHVFAKAPGALRPGQKRCPVCKAAVGSASNKCKPPCGHVFKAAKAKAPGVSKAAKAKATEGGCGRAVDTASKQCKLCDHVFAKAPGALGPGQKRCPVCSAAVASASNECKPSCGHVFKKKGKRPQPGSLCSGAGCGARVLDKDKVCGVCGCVNTAATFPSRCKGCGQGSRRRMDSARDPPPLDLPWLPAWDPKQGTAGPGWDCRPGALH